MQTLASFGLLMIVMGFSGGAWYLWEHLGNALIPAGRYLVGAGLLLVGIATLVSLIRRKEVPRRSAFINHKIWILGLFAIFLSDWMNRSWVLFDGPAIRGELILAALLSYFILGTKWQLFFRVWPLVSAGILIWSFFLASNGSLLFSDDHATFILRFKLLTENFPRIPFWSPLWNAGFDARDFFATGALNAFILASPFFYLFSVEQIYPYLISFLLWVLTPSCVYLAARVLQTPRTAAAIASSLSMCTGLFWYRWALKYGTVGFITSSALFPLVVALAVRLITTNTPRWRDCFALALAATLMLLWSPSGIAALPLAILAVPRLPYLLRSKRHLCTLALILACNLPWMSMMWKVSKVSKFLNTNSSISVSHSLSSSTSESSPAPTAQQSGASFRHQGGQLSGKKIIEEWHKAAVSLNPLLLVLAIPSLLALPANLFQYFAAIALWLFLAGTAGVSLKPQLELDRMIVLDAMLLTVPIGLFLRDIFYNASHGHRARLTAGFAAAFVIIGPCAAASVVLNRSDDTYFFVDKDLRGFSQAVKEHAGAGRVLFSGCVLHELSGGHLAPLPMWTGTPMYATSYAHNIWKYEQPFTEAALAKGDQGISEFLDLTNATLVSAHEPVWIHYFESRPDQYTRVWRGEQFFLFKRVGYQPSYAVAGELSNLAFTSASVTLTPLSENLVIKFRYFPFLSASGCSMKPFSSPLGLELVELNNCEIGKPITISSVSPLTRLLTPGL